MKALVLILAAWTAHPIIPFGPVSPCNACTPIPGQATITWATPDLDENTGQPFTVDHYVLYYEDANFNVSVVDGIHGNSYTLTGLASGMSYTAWLTAQGIDGDGHTAVTPLIRGVAP